MERFFERGILTTLGIWLLVHEKADELIKDMIARGKMTPEQGRRLIDDLSVKVDEEKDALSRRLDELLLGAVGASSRTGSRRPPYGRAGEEEAEIRKLEVRVAELEAHAARLEARIAELEARLGETVSEARSARHERG